MDDLIARNLAYLASVVGKAQDAQLNQLDQMRHALYKGIADGLSYPRTQPAAIGLMCQLFPLIAHRGYGDEWLTLIERARPLATARQQIELLLQAGKIHRQQLAYDASLNVLEQALFAAIRQEEPVLRAMAHLALGNTFYHQGEYEAAQQQGILSADPQGGETHYAIPEVAASVANLLGLIALEMGESERAIVYFNDSIAQRAPDKRRDQATTYANLGRVLVQDSQYEAALVACDNGLALLDALAESDEYVRVLVIKSTALTHLNLLTEAEKTLLAASACQTSNRFHAATIAINLGYVLRETGRPADALSWTLTGRDLWEVLDQPIQLGNAWGELGHVRRALGESHAAKSAYTAALALLENYPDHVWAQSMWWEFRRAMDQVDQA